jgi:hypothetical protein
VDFTKPIYTYDTCGQKSENWIYLLETGQNPSDAETLLELQYE